MDKETILNNIFDSDSLGLLEVKTKNPIITADDRLVASFKEINDFIAKNGNEPQKSTNMNERKLFSRLKGIRENFDKMKALKKYDKYDLLECARITMADINSLDDILNSDTLGVLDTKKEEDIYTLVNVPKIEKSRAETDFVARRTKFKNFEGYKGLFKECQKDLKEGKRKLVKFNEKFFKEGAFFVLKGVLVYLKKIKKPRRDKHHKLDARTTTIFENGTYSNMLLRSLGKGLYEDGYFVSEHEDRIMDDLTQTTREDTQNGYIYILKSLSHDDRITTKRNLYKIGFSTTDVETRIKNAKQDPTYLMSDVQIISSFRVYNVNPHKLEQLIHKFFSNSCLDIDIVDKKGNIHKPREWFIAPTSVIEEAIELISNGKIIDYRYDSDNENIVLRR